MRNETQRRDLWPLHDFDRLRSQIDALFEDDRQFGTPGLFDRSRSPQLDVVETDDAILVACDVPGVDAKEIDLNIVNNVLTLRGEKREGSRDDAKTVRRETWYGAFQRTITLPDSIDPDNVSAELTNGVLTIHIAKREERKPKKIGIEVK